MCGIAGFWSAAPNSRRNAQLVAMTTAIRHRGPDGDGLWLDDAAGIALGHRRLSIIDLSPNGAQPMHSQSGRYVLVYNGEVYNAAELKAAVEQRHSVDWRGHSDTEILLAYIEEFGLTACLTAAVGMFALALWDKQERSLQLGRDRAGEKPLYYGWQGDTFLFGSDIAALQAHPTCQRKVDPLAVSLLLHKAYIPAPMSIYAGLFKLPPATILTLRAQDLQQRALPSPQAYWSYAQCAQFGLDHTDRRSEAEQKDELEHLLVQSIKGQMLSDVPLGTFLSGGIDSTLVVALAQANSGQPIKTYTIGSHDPQMNEADAAAAVAKHLGTEHTSLMATETDMLGLIPQLARLYSEPFADSSAIPTSLVARLARQHVTVALSGDGGDEVFGGYNRYLAGAKIWQRLSKLPVSVRRAMAHGIESIPVEWLDKTGSLLQRLPGWPTRFALFGDKLQKTARTMGATSAAEFYQGISSFLGPQELLLHGKALPNLTQPTSTALEQPENFTAWMMAQDFLTYLPDDILVKVDRAAMASGLEARAPYLDHRVVEFALRLPVSARIHNGLGKQPLRQLLNKYVPQELMDRPKMGFGLPLGRWLRGELRPWAESLLAPQRLREQDFVDPVRISKLWQRHLSGQQNLEHMLWPILMLHSWQDEQRQQLSPPAQVA